MSAKVLIDRAVNKVVISELGKFPEDGSHRLPFLFWGNDFNRGLLFRRFPNQWSATPKMKRSAWPGGLTISRRINAESLSTELLMRQNGNSRYKIMFTNK
jgi:hypothetical protein